MIDYVFTADWTKAFLENAPKLFAKYKDQPVNYLEVGVMEGRSMCWMLDNILTHPDARAVGVDVNVRPNGWKNLERHGDKVKIIVGDSYDVVSKLNEKFDIIYIDGGHSPKQVMFDSVACWEIAKDIILWDDYLVKNERCHAQKGIDNFLACVPQVDYKVIMSNAQFAVRKVT